MPHEHFNAFPFPSALELHSTLDVLALVKIAACNTGTRNTRVGVTHNLARGALGLPAEAQEYLAPWLLQDAPSPPCQWRVPTQLW